MINRSGIPAIALIAILMMAVGCSTSAPAQAPTPTSKSAAPSSPTTSPAAPAASKKTQIMMRASETTSGRYVYQAAAAQVIGDANPDFNVTVVSIASATEGMNRLSNKQVDLVPIGMDGAYSTYHGLSGFEDVKQPKLRMLWASEVSDVAFVVREDSGVTKLEDLNGKGFNSGGTGTSTAKLAENALSEYGVRPNYLVASFSDAIDAVKNRRIVGLVKSTAETSPDAVIMQVQAATPIRILGWPKDALSRIQQKYPYYGAGAVPAGVYKADWNKEPIPTWVQVIAYAALSDMPDDVAYKIVKAVSEDKVKQKAAYPGTASDFSSLTLDQSNIFIHAGAIKYFREKGLTIPSNLIPPEAK